jgi:phosphatidylserine decarboxylase
LITQKDKEIKKLGVVNTNKDKTIDGRDTVIEELKRDMKKIEMTKVDL